MLSIEFCLPVYFAGLLEVSDLEVIKLQFILKLKIKCNDWLLADTCVRKQLISALNFKQLIIALYFEFETVLKFYNLKASYMAYYYFMCALRMWLNTFLV